MLRACRRRCHHRGPAWWAARRMRLCRTDGLHSPGGQTHDRYTTYARTKGPRRPATRCSHPSRRVAPHSRWLSRRRLACTAGRPRSGSCCAAAPTVFILRPVACSYSSTPSKPGGRTVMFPVPNIGVEVCAQVSAAPWFGRVAAKVRTDRSEGRGQACTRAPGCGRRAARARGMPPLCGSHRTRGTVCSL